MDMDSMTSLVASINSVLWGPFCLIPLLVGTGIYFTVRMRFIQIRRFGRAFKFVIANV